MKISINSETTSSRVKILSPKDFLESNYYRKKFSSREKFSAFDTLAFFSINIDFIYLSACDFWMSGNKDGTCIVFNRKRLSYVFLGTHLTYKAIGITFWIARKVKEMIF